MEQNQDNEQGPVRVNPESGWWFIDPGVRFVVKILNEFGIETFESCQGGEGHCYPEPTVRFYGDPFEGYRAYTVAKQHGLRVHALRRAWSTNNGELTGPHWEMVFLPRPDRVPLDEDYLR